MLKKIDPKIKKDKNDEKVKIDPVGWNYNGYTHWYLKKEFLLPIV